jgi:hypothetical protein
MSNPDASAIDPEALGEEREEYPDPESYPPPEVPAEETTDGSVPDPDIAAGDVEGTT